MKLICTSKLLRTSSRVSPAFILFWHRSASFGCHRLCSYSNHASCGSVTSAGLLPPSQCIAFTARPSFSHSNTRTDGRLLGPCFRRVIVSPSRRLQTAQSARVCAATAKQSMALPRARRPHPTQQYHLTKSSGDGQRNDACTPRVSDGTLPPSWAARAAPSPPRQSPANGPPPAPRRRTGFTKQDGLRLSPPRKPP